MVIRILKALIWDKRGDDATNSSYNITGAAKTVVAATAATAMAAAGATAANNQAQGQDKVQTQINGAVNAGADQTQKVQQALK
jgi:hypothetical protein